MLTEAALGWLGLSDTSGECLTCIEQLTRFLIGNLIQNFAYWPTYIEISKTYFPHRKLIGVIKSQCTDI